MSKRKAPPREQARLNEVMEVKKEHAMNMFRHQFTDMECGPVTILNGLRYLLNAPLPTPIVQRIHSLCDDKGGLPKELLQATVRWLDENRFINKRITLKYVEKGELNFTALKRRVRPEKCAAICWVYNANKEQSHYLLAVKHTHDFIYFFDPLPRKPRQRQRVGVELLGDGYLDPDEPLRAHWAANLKITKGALEKMGDTKGSHFGWLGQKKDRVGVFLTKR